jgi:hypothetical protein
MDYGNALHAKSYTAHCFITLPHGANQKTLSLHLIAAAGGGRDRVKLFDKCIIIYSWFTAVVDAS